MTDKNGGLFEVQRSTDKGCGSQGAAELAYHSKSEKQQKWVTSCNTIIS